MERPAHLKSHHTKIFLDSGNPVETRRAISLLGFLDGQTTNPTLIAAHPAAQEKLKSGNKFSKPEVLALYRDIVREISALIPHGSVSVEVFADEKTYADNLFEQATEMFKWIPNAHIKFQLSVQGLRAAYWGVGQGFSPIRINMTLCFSLEQAAAVHAATRGARHGDVYVSPFVGRLDDIGKNGMDLVRNILQLYKKGDRHVAVLAASIRNLDHLMASLQCEADIVTAPLKVLEAWAAQGLPLPDSNFLYRPKNLATIPYQDIALGQHFFNFAIQNELTAQGIRKFANDWNALLVSPP